MKRISLAAIVASALTLPLLSQAQAATTQITRAQVRAELTAAEQAGQYPLSDIHYPDPASDSAVEYVADRAVAGWSYGPSMAGRSDSGSRHFRNHLVTRAQPDSTDIYRGQ
ncbi:DUF4148 domain-containing protein [Paraburkholderia mimosarum]|uniref:DUF4148 domain-containing protein n=1 Tax=Paraburkholderia mimosarum TaxID=312026 RepID=UPI0039C1911C